MGRTGLPENWDDEYGVLERIESEEQKMDPAQVSELSLLSLCPTG
jgi:hypothetical protein